MAGAQVTLSVEGLYGLTRELQSLGVEVDDLKDAMARIAERGRSIASAAAPVRSGALAADIRGNRAKAKAVVTAGRARIPYAGPINYGWPRRGIRAALFMQKASDDLEPIAPQLLITEINRLIRNRNLS